MHSKTQDRIRLRRRLNGALTLVSGSDHRYARIWYATPGQGGERGRVKAAAQLQADFAAYRQARASGASQSLIRGWRQIVRNGLEVCRYGQVLAQIEARAQRPSEGQRMEAAA